MILEWRPRLREVSIASCSRPGLSNPVLEPVEVELARITRCFIARIYAHSLLFCRMCSPRLSKILIKCRTVEPRLVYFIPIVKRDRKSQLWARFHGYLGHDHLFSSRWSVERNRSSSFSKHLPSGWQNPAPFPGRQTHSLL
jgi:hypothetical protein